MNIKKIIELLDIYYIYDKSIIMYNYFVTIYDNPIHIYNENMVKARINI